MNHGSDILPRAQTRGSIYEGSALMTLWSQRGRSYKPGGHCICWLTSCRRHYTRRLAVIRLLSHSGICCQGIQTFSYKPCLVPESGLNHYVLQPLFFVLSYQFFWRFENVSCLSVWFMYSVQGRSIDVWGFRCGVVVKV